MAAEETETPGDLLVCPQSEEPLSKRVRPDAGQLYRAHSPVVRVVEVAEAASDVKTVTAETEVTAVTEEVAETVVVIAEAIVVADQVEEAEASEER